MDPCYKLTLVVPCFNEERMLEKCIKRILELESKNLKLEIIIVDDGSQDNSLEVAKALAAEHSQIVLISHDRNRGKGAALRTGFDKANGDFVIVQDADLEYNPAEIKKLLLPLINNEADVVLGSRFLSGSPHRVLYFWHYLANRLLTLLSNMFSDLNLTDMETCYKLFKKDVIKRIHIEENRFGVEPELVAKMARMRLRIYEMGISYYGRTYAEGKKIKPRDGLRALYCIFHYNAPTAPLPIQLLIYLFIGGFSAVTNLVSFLILLSWNRNLLLSAGIAYFTAAICNYLLCIALLFRHKAKWDSLTELLLYFLVTGMVGVADLISVKAFIMMSFPAWIAKGLASLTCLILNFVTRRYLIFPESTPGEWKPQHETACTVKDCTSLHDTAHSPTLSLKKIGVLRK